MTYEEWQQSETCIQESCFARMQELQARIEVLEATKKAQSKEIQQLLAENEALSLRLFNYQTLFYI